MEINVSDKKETKCKFFDEGFSRYSDKCRNVHPSDICEKRHCKRESCPKRHPKTCRYNQNCRRGRNCMYLHVSVEKDSEKDFIKKKLGDIENELKEKDKKMLVLEQKNKDLWLKINELIEEVKDIKKNPENIPKVNDRKFACDDCEFISKNAGGLNKHVKAKHKELATVKCDTCNFTSKNKEDLSNHTFNEHEYKKYDGMSYNDQFEVKEIICDQLCWGAFGWHRCFTDEDDNSYMGINIPGMVEDDDDFEIQTFPCDYSEYTSKSMDNVKKHFQVKHKDCYRIKCWECEKEVKTMTEFKQHIGTYHYEERFVGEPGPKSQALTK